MAKIRKTAERLLLVLLSASIFFNSPSLAELVLCIGPDCVPEERHATEDPCESAAEPTGLPSLHSHEEDGGCESCIRLSLLHEAGESTRPTPGPDGSRIAPAIVWVSSLVSHHETSSHGFIAPSPPHQDPRLAHLRTVRLLI